MTLNSEQLRRLDLAIRYMAPGDRPQIVDEGLANILAPLSTIFGQNQTVFIENLRDRPMSTMLQFLKLVQGSGGGTSPAFSFTANDGSTYADLLTKIGYFAF